jgi:glycosyltransferase involved in cell wall biosynthesis
VNISVLIPTYNSEKTIKQTLNSVLLQTLAPHEILVLDDGSTDHTVSILESYGSSITFYRQENRGVANARNALCDRAKGELLAFLDHDDLWHPINLEAKYKAYLRYPHGVGIFTGHTTFTGYEPYRWGQGNQYSSIQVETIDSISFIRQYAKTPMKYGSASFLCLPRKILKDLGSEPFPEVVSGVDDYYLCNHLALLGPIIYVSAPLVAYRILESSLSNDTLEGCRLAVKALALLENEYRQGANQDLMDEFLNIFASGRRYYAKKLLGEKIYSTARKQLLLSIRHNAATLSIGKSLSLLMLSYLPEKFQPKWPSRYR